MSATTSFNNSSTTAATSSSSTSTKSPQQWIHILRHGERRDFIESHTPSCDWHRYDPPLSSYGHTQATEAGAWFADSINNGHFTIDRIICSPFIRTVETAWNVVKAVRSAGGHIGPISIEYGVAEWHPATWINDFLPQRTAVDIIREHEGGTSIAGTTAHAAIDHEYKTLIGNDYFHNMINTGIGETLEAASKRAAHFIDLLTSRYPTENILIVTHAIHSIGLARAFLRDQSFPVRAGVCSITSLQRPLPLLESSPTNVSDIAISSSSSSLSASPIKWNVIHNGLSSHLSRGEQHLWLIHGEEERVYGVRKAPQGQSKVPVYVTLTDDEKAALFSKQQKKSVVIATAMAISSITTCTTETTRRSSTSMMASTTNA